MNPTPKRSNSLAVALLALVGLIAVACLGGWLLVHKRIDPRWAELDIGGRDARAIAISPDGVIYVAANGFSQGGVLVSSDGGRSFVSSGIASEGVWSVSWLPSARTACAGTRDGLYCFEGGTLRGPLTHVDTYFAIETPAGVMTGGHPAVLFQSAGSSEFRSVASVSYAVSDAVVVGTKVFLASDRLLVSDASGTNVAPAPGVTFGAHALAARGSRVYAAGGSFGGFVFRSDDGGERWQKMTNPGSQPEVIVIHPDNADVVFMGTHGDVRPGDAYLSLDGAHTWRALGCPGAEVHGLAVDGTYLYCGATSLSGRRGLWRRPLREVIAEARRSSGVTPGGGVRGTSATSVTALAR